MTKPYERHISLNVGTSTPEEWDHVYTTLSEVAKSFSKCSSVGISSIVVDDEDLDELDELMPLRQETLFRVSAALRETGMSEPEITAAIVSLQNYGILFRERA